MYGTKEGYILSQHKPGKFKWYISTGERTSSFNPVRKIEDIINLGADLTLTPSAIKQLGL